MPDDDEEKEEEGPAQQQEQLGPELPLPQEWALEDLRERVRLERSFEW